MLEQLLGKRTSLFIWSGLYACMGFLLIYVGVDVLLVYPWRSFAEDGWSFEAFRAVVTLCGLVIGPYLLAQSLRTVYRALKK